MEKLGAVSFHPSLGQVQSSPGSPQAQEPAPGQQTCMQQGGVWHQESARFAAGRTKPEVLIIALIQTDIHSLLSDHKTFLQQHVQSSRGSQQPFSVGTGNPLSFISRLFLLEAAPSSGPEVPEDSKVLSIAALRRQECWPEGLGWQPCRLKVSDTSSHGAGFLSPANMPKT